MDYSKAFVCLMGMGTVFFGLICLIALTYFMGWLCRKTGLKTIPDSVPAEASASAENQQELLAAISAAIAENLGTDISGIRILSIKKV